MTHEERTDLHRFEERTLEVREIYRGRIVHLEEHTVQLPNGRTSLREIVHHPGAVAVIAEPEPGRLVLVRQYRKPCEAVLLEIPAGKLEPGEDPCGCAARELSEETGYEAARVEKVGAFFTSPGFADELIHLFYARDLTPGAAHPDPDERVELVMADRNQVREWLESGEVRDAKTLVGLWWWLAHKDGCHR